MHVALVPYDAELDVDNLLHVVAALQIQVVRDLAPIWGVSATVSAFASLENVPPGYCPLVLVDEVPARRGGVHFSSGGRPFALVDKTDPGWSRMASHELLELITDPSGSRLAPGRSVLDIRAPDQIEGQQGQVEYLVEICDPCQKHTYTIDGVLVSDFVTPQYYGPLATMGDRYSFAGNVTGPREVCAGGYLTWRVPTTREIWQQFVDDDGRSTMQALSPNALPSDVSVREWIDDYPDRQALPGVLPEDKPPLSEAQIAYDEAVKSAAAYGATLRDDVDRLYAEIRALGVQASARSAKEPDAVKSARTIKLSSQDRAPAIQLIRDLAQDDDVRKRFEADPSKVLAERGIATLGVVPPAGTTLPEPDVFAAVLPLIEDGFGDASNLPFGPFWWLGVLGGF